jgi:hypothetical protein
MTGDPHITRLSDDVIVVERNFGRVEITEKQLTEWAEQLVECAADGESEEWITAFSEWQEPGTVEKVKTIARKIWRERMESAA